MWLTGSWALVQNGVLPNPFYTPGVQNIEKRYSSGGGTKNHLPAAGTKLGDSEDVLPRQETQKGMGTPYQQEKYGEQKPDVSRFSQKGLRFRPAIVAFEALLIDVFLCRSPVLSTRLGIKHNTMQTKENRAPLGGLCIYMVHCHGVWI